MKRNMTQWLTDIKADKKAMPILSFPGIQIINESISDLVYSGQIQAKCMKAIADRYDISASLSCMDLSVEAEAFGSEIRVSDDEVPTVIGSLITCEEDADLLRVPEVGEKRTGEYVKTIEYAVQEITDIPVLAGHIGPFSLAGRLMDMTEIMIMAYTEPETVHKVLEKTTAFLLKYVQAFLDAGANGVVIAEPAAGLLSPDMIAEFSTPYVKKIVEAFDNDEFLVVYHNCGNTIPLIPSILDTKARVLHFGNAIRLSEILPLIPEDVYVCGNVDPSSQFKNGTPESIKEDTLRVLNECSKYENFIISSGCDIPPLSPLENIDSFFNTVKEFYTK